MSGIAYIDESQRNGRYLLAAMLVRAAEVSVVRRALKAAAPGGGVARRHFSKESDRERKQALSVYRVLPGILASVHVVEACVGPPVIQRAEALRALVPMLIGRGADRLVFDHIDHADAMRDRQALVRLTRGSDITYAHEPPHSGEPMLWVPDAVAWCAGRAGWKAELDGWVTITEV